MKSVCKTQLGNQLSSYAALLYFTSKFGYHAFLDPVQTRALGQVFKTEKLSIGAFDFYRCGCPALIVIMMMIMMIMMKR